MADDIKILELMVGKWEGDKGMDVAPLKDGKEQNPYFETITIEPIGAITNAKEQEIVAVFYTQIVTRKSNNEVFHHEVGYYVYDEKANTIMQSFSIPRAVSIVAGGILNKVSNNEISFDLKAKEGDIECGISQAPFMAKKAKTIEFIHNVKVNGDELIYKETSVLEIYGKTFDHTDENTLRKIR